MSTVGEIAGVGNSDKRTLAASHQSASSTIACVGPKTELTLRSRDLIESLCELLEAELGCFNFGVFNVDEPKGVLWPMFHSSGESILRPVDLMCNHSLRHAVESGVIIVFRFPLQLEEFLPPVSAFVPLPGKGKTTRLLVLFDLKRSSSFEGQNEVLQILQEHVSRLLAEFEA